MKDVLFENEVCLVLNKRCGEDSQRLAEGFFPVHRLDQPVSGCQLVAKDQGSAAYLGGLFSREDQSPIKKCYWAIVEMINGQMSNEGWVELEHFVSFDPKRNKSFVCGPEGKGGKKARLLYRPVGMGENYQFLEIMLLTGRHHQIRAQLAAIGLHIKGDLKYGAKRSEKGGGIRLHARTLEFPNPQNRGELIRVQAPLHDADPLWQAFLQMNNGQMSNEE